MTLRILLLILILLLLSVYIRSNQLVISFNCFCLLDVRRSKHSVRKGHKIWKILCCIVNSEGMKQRSVAPIVHIVVDLNVSLFYIWSMEIAQSAGAVEYVDCISKCPGHDTKPSDEEASSGAFEIVKYHFIAITPRSTLT